ncbi:DUF2059 domain-containing protein [Acidipila sp. EB88]|uniref:DUF2059 domain-containing protein n=1 Tax=Acidipila sp. EB88 TaxID=2305226 RepID=UPI0013157DDB|nr:DUF2059 domain-containing protein [Acidipila sp. EB88]
MHKFVVGAVAPFLLAVSVMAQTSAAPAAKPVPPLPTAGSAKPGQPPAPAHPLTIEQAHELMQLTGADQTKSRLIENIMAYFQRAFPPFVPADVKTDMKASLDKMDIEGPIVTTYQRYLSTENATQIIAFYKTPAGKDLLAITPYLSSEIQQTALKNGQDTARAVIERHKAEIEAAQKTYEQQHAAPAPTLGAPAAPSGTAPTTPKKPQQ